MGRRTFYVVSPVKVRLPKSKPKSKRVLKAIQYTTFEEAMVSLRQGRRIQRASWHPESFIFKTQDNMVFVSLPSSAVFSRPIKRWHPYASDFLATDWHVAP
jgi:hypothetical protein